MDLTQGSLDQVCGSLLSKVADSAAKQLYIQVLSPPEMRVEEALLKMHFLIVPSQRATAPSRAERKPQLGGKCR